MMQQQQQQSEEEQLAIAIARSLGSTTLGDRTTEQESGDGGAGGAPYSHGGIHSGTHGGSGAAGNNMALVDEVLPAMAFDDAKGFLLDGSDSSAGGGHECSICLVEIAPKDKVRLLPCVHVYHQGCIDHWFRKATACPSCPTCKTPVAIG